MRKKKKEPIRRLRFIRRDLSDDVWDSSTRRTLREALFFCFPSLSFLQRSGCLLMTSLQMMAAAVSRWVFSEVHSISRRLFLDKHLFLSFFSSLPFSVPHCKGEINGQWHWNSSCCFVTFSRPPKSENRKKKKKWWTWRGETKEQQ